jgi:hypothetical protein
VALPSHFRAGFSTAGSTMKKVGSPSTGYFSRNAAFFASSVLIESQTNRPACSASEGSVRTFART